MESSLRCSPYSLHFNILRYMGAWTIETKSRKRLAFYMIYKVFNTIVSFYAIFALSRDLISVFGNFKKTTWNLCVTALFSGIFIKNLIIFHNNHLLNDLRGKLHRDQASQTSLKDTFIHNSALRELRALQMSFYGTAGLFIPVWLLTRYFSYLWGPRQLPLPANLPVEVDINDNEQYHILFVLIGGGGVAGLVFVIETEMAMFTILIQISREYNFLLNDISKLNEMYDDDSSASDYGDKKKSERKYFKAEINPRLRKAKTKILVKKLSIRQQELIGYTEDFEYVYNKPMLVQFFAASLLMVVSAMYCILVSADFSADLSFLLAYTMMLVVDIFLICWFSTRIYSQCCEVGVAVYSTLWYEMDPEIQKDLVMMIMRSQSPPKITSGKMVKLDLVAFTHCMRNIYSWLALFRQMEIRSND